jgi:hypothetical protein
MQQFEVYSPLYSFWWLSDQVSSASFNDVIYRRFIRDTRFETFETRVRFIQCSFVIYC